MIHRVADVAIVGSGFGGSLLALLLARQGRRVVLVDRSAHPRFAIGESSTPIADMVLADLADRYGLPRLAPLAQYGSWCRTYPDVLRGRKRGFSYFRHEPGRDFEPDPDHTRELLVAASSDDDRCDTHWLRADVDGFLVREAQAAGVELWDRLEIEDCQRTTRWHLVGQREGQPLRVAADFLVDATGSGDFQQRWLGVADDSSGLRTWSRALYAHFRPVMPWREWLAQHAAAIADYPFDCDAAALHHVLDDAWMWMLRFDHGVVSVGIACGPSHPLPEHLTPADEWRSWLARYPSIARQLAAAEIVDPPAGLIRTGRLQRLASPAAGSGWAALPHAVGFIDPLHSTGIALTLTGVERLAGLLERHWQQPTLDRVLGDYHATIRQELDLVDQLVHVAYAATRQFRLFTLATILYFTACVAYETRRRARKLPNGAAFLCADDADLRQRLDRASRAILAAAQEEARAPDLEALEDEIRTAIQPYNSAGLLHRAARNMYRHTAAR